MILLNNKDRTAVLSNVGEVGEFKIKTSAHAFKILSSSLYANKIKAVIRELSCNALDSHIMAGKRDVPFEIHLPSYLEPWFSVKDFGVGLNHEQVTQVYTTYFESTKGDSNDVIGGLGLGSKTPFCVTDTFTVVAIKDNHKGIYTAFLNESGLPSIALMGEEYTEEAPGVEVRFPVENINHNFYKFQEEATEVFRWFNERPVVISDQTFEFLDNNFVDRDIIPGVHCLNNNSWSTKSIAVMGNIAYPIEVPNAAENLGDLAKLLECGLVINFDIGELDFQASREGLSYIKETIQAIKHKLEQVHISLYDKFAEEADKITNLWEKIFFIREKHRSKLWSSVAQEYAKNNGLWHNSAINFKDANNYGCLELFQEKMEKLNIGVRMFSHSYYKLSETSHQRNYTYVTETDGSHKTIEHLYFNLSISPTSFVINDMKKSQTMRRMRNHTFNNANTVVLLTPIDPTKEMNLKKFYKSIHNPPKAWEIKVSDMEEPEKIARVSSLGNAMYLYHNHYTSSEKKKWSWSDSNHRPDDTSYFKEDETYYYVPLTGLTSILDYKGTIKELATSLKNTQFFIQKIFGIRKSDLKMVEELPNWKLLEPYIIEQLKNNKVSHLSLFKNQSDITKLVKYDFKTHQVDLASLKEASPFLRFYKEFEKVETVSKQVEPYLRDLYNKYNIKFGNSTVEVLRSKYVKRAEELVSRYPLLKHLSLWQSKETLTGVIEYISAIDSMKGVK